MLRASGGKVIEAGAVGVTGAANAARSFAGRLRGYVTRVVLVVVDGASLPAAAHRPGATAAPPVSAHGWDRLEAPPSEGARYLEEPFRDNAFARGREHSPPPHSSHRVEP